LAFGIYFILIKRIGATILSTANMLFPVFGLIEGVLVLGEWRNVKLFYKICQVVGSIVILAGMALILKFPKPEATKCLKPEASKKEMEEQTPFLNEEDESQTHSSQHTVN